MNTSRCSKRKMRGGAGAAEYAASVYGGPGQQSAGANGVIAMQSPMNAPIVAPMPAGAAAAAPAVQMTGGKKMGSRRRFSIPAFLMYVNPIAKKSKKNKSSKKRRGKTQKRRR